MRPTGQAALAEAPIYPKDGTLRMGIDYSVYDGYELGKNRWFQIDQGAMMKDTIGMDTRKAVAVKRRRDTTMEEVSKILENECEMARRIPLHRNILKFVGYDIEAQQSLFELAERTLGNLVEQEYKKTVEHVSNLTARKPVIGARQWIYTAYSLVSGLRHLHDNGFLHCNINPNNILLRKESCQHYEVFGPDPIYNVLISDFTTTMPYDKGGRRDSGISVHSIDSTPPDPIEMPDISSLIPYLWDDRNEAYMAPDLLRFIEDPKTHKPLGISVDMHAAGTSLLAAAIGTSPYTSSTRSPDKHLDEAERFRQYMYVSHGDPLKFAQSLDERALRCLDGGYVAEIVKLCLDGRTAEAVQNYAMSFIAHEWQQKGRSDDAWEVPASSCLAK